jgi:hypothetical protein
MTGIHNFEWVDFNSKSLLFTISKIISFVIFSKILIFLTKIKIAKTNKQHTTKVFANNYTHFACPHATQYISFSVASYSIHQRLQDGSGKPTAT